MLAKPVPLITGVDNHSFFLDVLLFQKIHHSLDVVIHSSHRTEIFVDHVLVCRRSPTASGAVVRPHGRGLVPFVSAKITVFTDHVPCVHALEPGTGFFDILMQVGRLRYECVFEVILPALWVLIGMMRCLEMQHHAERFLGVTCLEPCQGLVCVDI